MARTQTYSMEQILAAREVLRQLPSREKEKSRAEVVEFLKGDLRKAVKQGHSLKEIQALLAAQGVNVSLSRMEAVLGQSREKIARKKVQHEELSAEDKDSATANVVRVFAGSDNPGKKFSTEPPS